MLRLRWEHCCLRAHCCHGSTAAHIAPCCRLRRPEPYRHWPPCSVQHRVGACGLLRERPCSPAGDRRDASAGAGLPAGQVGCGVPAPGQRRGGVHCLRVHAAAAAPPGQVVLLQRRACLGLHRALSLSLSLLLTAGCDTQPADFPWPGRCCCTGAPAPDSTAPHPRPEFVAHS